MLQDREMTIMLRTEMFIMIHSTGSKNSWAKHEFFELSHSQ
jgi:hypothetical protein